MANRRLLITGADGQLGRDVVKAARAVGDVPLALGRAQLDLAALETIPSTVAALKPDAIIHCGAYTDVEQAELEVELCFRVNADATRALALCAQKLEIPFVYISTDYVFDGEKKEPYTETDAPNPLNVYGQSKLKGEQHVQDLLKQHFILRLSWVFGLNGRNFVKSLLRLSASQAACHVVDDQVGSPTATADVAPQIIRLLDSDQYGLYHLTNTGFCSWFDFATAVFQSFNIQTPLIPISAATLQRRAQRPKNSRMSKEKWVEAGFAPLPAWQESLEAWRLQYERFESK